MLSNECILPTIQKLKDLERKLRTRRINILNEISLLQKEEAKLICLKKYIEDSMIIDNTTNNKYVSIDDKDYCSLEKSNLYFIDDNTD
ncbi:hypothetical protein CWI37_0221p0050 [Hamiltosporidium tvaerminnensis]|uniref:Uncharacterized protein n=2 Tax=Hamiltosporidium TaxID=1176354 RepID=A0A4Q9L8Y6_9MICR|nr:hypothetical protein LUQ84_000249 [Hamiltosporidium tvaerminnensis]TBT97955.1 hypothetical protein CWI36_2615p0010 [Hamiltosporidium magnivora]TBU03441.1 hypothetical protein CWI37_0294p0050 [Hamiltosporidium tvaerminnensis]TBU03856.1 hypothetical protein CWI37_0221p0050 [Hamiltosporidium tvaerminnensis]